jgi:hypothetical protein
VKNPINPPKIEEIDRLIQTQINDDMWKSMISPLPCLETTSTCVQQLQSQAVSASPVIKKIDESISTIEQKIDEANKSNKLSIKLAVFEPGLQYFLRQGADTGQTGQTPTTPTQTGFLQNILGIFTRPVGLINDLLNVIGIPILRSFTGGNQEQRAAAIAISDLRVKTEELRKSKEEIAAKTRDAVQLSVLEFDTRAREFQIAQSIAQRDQQRFGLFQVNYRFGASSTEAYLAQQNALDRTRAQVLREWAAMRSQLERIKLLCLAKEED